MLQGADMRSRILLQVDLILRTFFYFLYRKGLLDLKKYPGLFRYNYTLLDDVIIKNEDGIFCCRKNTEDLDIVSVFNEEKIREFFKKFESGIFVDVGANIGKYTILVGNHLKNGKIIAIEPDPDNFVSLKRNVKLNKLRNIVCINKAVYSENRTLKLYKAEGSVGHSVIVKPSNNYIEIQGETLDNILKNIGVQSIDLLKIDVEGAESEVLKGSIETLKKSPNIKIIFEAWDANYLDKCKAIIEPLGFKIKKIDEDEYLASRD